MGMGYAGVQVQVLSMDYMQELFGERWTKFMDESMEECEDYASWWEASCYGCGDADERGKLCTKMFADMAEEFANKHPGLHIAANYHSREEMGDRYDDVDGPFIELLGAYVISDAAQKIKQHWDNQSYVQFG